MEHKEIIASIGKVVMLPCIIKKSDDNWDGEGVYVCPNDGNEHLTYFIPKKKGDLDEADVALIASILPESDDMKNKRINSIIKEKEKEIAALKKEIV